MKNSAKKERFFAVVLKLIHRKGFKATTMRDIAQELNFEVANVYNYIPSKQALLETYIFDTQNEFHDAMELILESSYAPDEKLRHVISSYIRITTKRPYEQALLVNEWRNLKESGLQRFLERRKAYENKLMWLLEDGMEQQLFKSADPKIATQTILASLRWLHNSYLQDDAPKNPIELEKQLLTFIFNGVSENG